MAIAGDRSRWGWPSIRSPTSPTSPPTTTRPGSCPRATAAPAGRRWLQRSRMEPSRSLIAAGPGGLYALSGQGFHALPRGATAWTAPVAVETNPYRMVAHPTDSSVHPGGRHLRAPSHHRRGGDLDHDLDLHVQGPLDRSGQPVLGAGRGPGHRRLQLHRWWRDVQQPLQPAGDEPGVTLGHRLAALSRRRHRPLLEHRRWRHLEQGRHRAAGQHGQRGRRRSRGQPGAAGRKPGRRAQPLDRRGGHLDQGPLPSRASDC